MVAKVFAVKHKKEDKWACRKYKPNQLSNARFYGNRIGPSQILIYMDKDSWEIKEYLVIDPNDKQTIVKLIVDAGLVTMSEPSLIEKSDKYNYLKRAYEEGLLNEFGVWKYENRRNNN